MKRIAFGRTDPGKKRANTEDAFLVNDAMGLYAVADGIGGNEGGEVASRIAVETFGKAIPDLLNEKGSVSTDAPSPALREAVIRANRAIYQVQSQNPGLANMGTTLTALLFRDNQACIAHIGDSRAYLFRLGKLLQLTDDHSFVAEQVLAGTFTKEQARSSPYRHMITRALGIAEDARPDLVNHELKKDDKFLLCTDGLTEMVTDEEIAGILSASPPQEAVENLLAAANAQGGVDNITAVVVWVNEV